MVCLQSRLAAKVKGTKSSDSDAGFQCGVWATGTVVQEWKLERVTGEGCSEKGKVYPSSEFMIAPWMGSGRVRPL